MKQLLAVAASVGVLFLLFATQSARVLEENFVVFVVWQLAMSAVIGTLSGVLVRSFALNQRHAKLSQTRAPGAAKQVAAWQPTVLAYLVGAVTLAAALCYVATGASPFDGLSLEVASPPYGSAWTNAAWIALFLLTVAAPIVVGRTAFVLSDTKEPLAPFAFFGFLAVITGVAIATLT